jgi:hypothetical protein
MFIYGSVYTRFCLFRVLFIQGSVYTRFCLLRVLFIQDSVYSGFCLDRVLFIQGSVYSGFCLDRVLFRQVSLYMYQLLLIKIPHNKFVCLECCIKFNNILLTILSKFKFLQRPTKRGK